MESIKELRDICNAGKIEKNWRIRLLRKYSIYFTWVLLHTNISANQVTFLMFLFGLSAVGLFMMGSYYLSLLAILFLHFSIFLDYCDGSVAKYRKTFSLKGAYYDLIHHIIVNPLLILGIGIGAYFSNPLPIPNGIFLIFGFMGMYGLMMDNFFKLKKYETYISFQKFDELKELEKKVPKHKEGIKVEIKDFFKIKIFNVIFVLGILNLLHYSVFIYGLLGPASALRSFLLWRNR